MFFVLKFTEKNYGYIKDIVHCIGGRGVADRYETRNRRRKEVGPRVYVVFHRRGVPIIANEREAKTKKNTTKNRKIKKIIIIPVLWVTGIGDSGGRLQGAKTKNRLGST